MHPVTVQYLKYPDQPHWRHEMLRLGQDEHGIWLGAPKGTIVQRGQEPPIAWQDPFVQLIPSDEWWSLIYNGDGGDTRLYIDIVTPANWRNERRVEMIDLDLDVVRYQDGSIAVLDEDEFDEHRRTLSYPDRFTSTALRVTDGVRRALEVEAAPFGETGAPWLELLTAQA